MNKSRLEWKVGLFVIVGLLLLAGLLIQFSKGTSLLTSTYRVHLKAGNANGLKNKAIVTMAGVQVGSVDNVKLGPGGTNVIISLRIYNQYKIHTNAEFSIEASGFLGDQFVAITAKPATPEIPVFRDNSDAIATAPMTLLAVANRVLTSLGNFDEAAASLRTALDDIHRGALNDLNLSNFSDTISNLKLASARAVTAISNIDTLVGANAPAIQKSVSNLTNFTEHIDTVALDLKGLLATNRAGIDRSVSNFESSTVILRDLMQDIQDGKGLAGKLLRDDALAAKTTNIVYDLSITTSNLNRLGLWGILWKQKEARRPESEPRAPLRSPKERAE
jgi:phospholipid/cholesterol/gamma-HCH transport system substrate-binding protein